MPARLIAIGDIHGCHLALRALIEAIEPTAKDTIVTLGDYVDRGPDSKNVIEQLLALRSQCKLITLTGNHETMMLASRHSSKEHDFWMQCGGRETLASYADSIENVPAEHWEFLESLAYTHETPEYFFIHANYLADQPIEEQPEWVGLWEHLDSHPPAPHESGKTAIVGHTPQTTCEILDLGHVRCIDTCCFGGGCLTAHDVETGDIWRADIDGNLI